MPRDPIGEGLDQFARVFQRELFHLFAHTRVIYSATDLVVQVANVARRPKCDTGGKPLRFFSFLSGDAHSRKDFKLLNVNLVSRVVAHLEAEHLSMWLMN